MINKRLLPVIIVLFFVFGCATTQVNSPVEPPRDLRGNLVLKRELTSRSRFDVYSFNDSLLIDYIEDNGRSTKTAVYNPNLGIMAMSRSFKPSHSPNRVAYSDSYEFYMVINGHIVQLLDDMAKNPELYKDETHRKTLKRVFKGNLPYLTRNGKYEGSEIVKRIEGARYFEALKAEGLNFHKLSSYNSRRPNGTTYQGNISGDQSNALHAFSSIGTVPDDNALRPLQIAKQKKAVNFARIVKEKTLLGEFSDSLNVNIKVINQSGFSIPKDLVGYKRELMVQDDFNPTQGSGVMVSAFTKNRLYKIECKPQEIKYDPASQGQNVDLVAYVKGKWFSSIYPKTEYKNSELGILLSKVTKDSKGNIVVKAELSNATDQYIAVKAVSIYLKGRIHSLYYSENIDLPPMSINEEISFTIYKDSKYFQKIRTAVEGYISISDPSSNKVDIGMSAKYVIANKEKTLFKKRPLDYKDIIEL